MAKVPTPGVGAAFYQIDLRNEINFVSKQHKKMNTNVFIENYLYNSVTYL